MKALEDYKILTLILLILAVFRIYLEVIKFNFSELPLTKSLFRGKFVNYGMSFHKMGFILSVGYFILFAPGFFLY